MAEIMKVMEAAKGIMRSSGNMHQWTDGYPFEAVVLSDMEKNGGFIRIDTYRDNQIMQHVIKKYGFGYCGIIFLANGDERLAYQKIMSQGDPL